MRCSPLFRHTIITAHYISFLLRNRCFLRTFIIFIGLLAGITQKVTATTLPWQIWLDANYRQQLSNGSTVIIYQEWEFDHEFKRLLEYYIEPVLYLYNTHFSSYGIGARKTVDNPPPGNEIPSDSQLRAYVFVQQRATVKNFFITLDTEFGMVGSKEKNAGERFSGAHFFCKPNLILGFQGKSWRIYNENHIYWNINYTKKIDLCLGFLGININLSPNMIFGAYYGRLIGRTPCAPNWFQFNIMGLSANLQF